MDNSLTNFELSESTVKIDPDTENGSGSDKSDPIEIVSLGDAESSSSKSDDDFDNNLPKTVTLLKHEKTGAKVYLIGTAHFSKESQEDVRKVITTVLPHVVVLELCSSRTNILALDEETILQEAKNIDMQKILTTIRSNGLYNGLIYLLVLNMSAYLTKEIGMAPGGEFRVAFKEASNIPHCGIHLGDRSMSITLQRALARLSWFQTVKLAWHLLTSKEPITHKLQERELFNGCLTSLWKIVKNIGFKYQKDDTRCGLMELPHIALKRVHFLHEYVKIKREGLYQFVFLDEIWIFKDGTGGHSWQDSNHRSVKKTKIGGPSVEDIEKCKEKDMLEQVLSDFSEQYPAFKEVFLDERDIYLTNSLQQAVQSRVKSSQEGDFEHEPIRVVGVVGMGHTPGIIKLWPTSQEQYVSAIVTIPPPSLTSKVIKRAYKISLLALGGYLIYKLVPIPTFLKENTHSFAQKILIGLRAENTFRLSIN